MSPTLRMRMFFLLRRARMARTQLNRPHVPSAHLVSYPVPQTRPDCGITPRYIAVLAVAFSAVVYANWSHTAPAMPPTCTQLTLS